MTNRAEKVRFARAALAESAVYVQRMLEEQLKETKDNIKQAVKILSPKARANLSLDYVDLGFLDHFIQVESFANPKGLQEFVMESIEHIPAKYRSAVCTLLLTRDPPPEPTVYQPGSPPQEYGC